MSSLDWDPTTAIVSFDPEAMNLSNDSSVGERLKSRRSTRSDRRCLRDAIKIEDSGSSQDPPIDSKKNPKSSTTMNSVTQISRTFGLPLSCLRIPNAAERPMDAGPEEIAVYEALFSYGFRGIVPSLVAAVSRYLGLSPGQLSPMVWRMLMALEVMGNLNSIEVSVASVLYAFYFKPYAGDINRYHLHPRRNLALVTNPEIDIGHLNKGDDAAGKKIIEQLLEIPSEWRSLEFLSSHLALEHSAIWDCNMSESRRASAPDPFELFLAASGKLAEMGGSVAASESQAKLNEVPRSGTVAAGKRKDGRSPCGPVEGRRVKVSPSSGGELGSSQSSSRVGKMKSKLLSWDMESIAEGSAELAADEVCRSLLKVMFSFSSMETKLAETVEESSKDHEASVYMRERYEVEKKRGEDQLGASDARDEEIRDLKDSIARCEQAKEGLQKGLLIWKGRMSSKMWR
ncbi:unnamed protein product [Cochlearia groenlandica]